MLLIMLSKTGVVNKSSPALREIWKVCVTSRGFTEPVLVSLGNASPFW